MNDSNGNGVDVSEGEPTQPKKLPELRPHLVVVRQIVYRGDAEAIKAQLDGSLPDGLFVVNGTFTIEMKTAPLEQETPQWLSQVKYDLIQDAKARREKAEREAKPLILNPHTLRPVK